MNTRENASRDRCSDIVETDTSSKFGVETETRNFVPFIRIFLELQNAALSTFPNLNFVKFYSIFKFFLAFPLPKIGPIAKMLNRDFRSHVDGAFKFSRQGVEIETFPLGGPDTT